MIVQLAVFKERPKSVKTQKFCPSKISSYCKCRKFQGVKLTWFFNCGSEVKYHGSYIVNIDKVKWHYFNCNTKVPSIGKTEIENDEDDK